MNAHGFTPAVDLTAIAQRKPAADTLPQPSQAHPAARSFDGVLAREALQSGLAGDLEAAEHGHIPALGRSSKSTLKQILEESFETKFSPKDQDLTQTSATHLPSATQATAGVAAVLSLTGSQSPPGTPEPAVAGMQHKAGPRLPGTRLPDGGKFVPPQPATIAAGRPAAFVDKTVPEWLPEQGATQPPRPSPAAFPELAEVSQAADRTAVMRGSSEISAGTSLIDRAAQLEQLLRPASVTPTPAPTKPAATQRSPDQLADRSQLKPNRLEETGLAGILESRSSVMPRKAPVLAELVGAVREQTFNPAGTQLPEGDAMTAASRAAGDRHMPLPEFDAGRNVRDGSRTIQPGAGLVAAAVDTAARPTIAAATPANATLAGSTGAADMQSAVAEQVGSRLIAMTVNGNHVAKLRLQPAELGSLEIRIAMQDDGAVVSINAQQPHARELIEASLPRLREMFEASGTGLLDVNVDGSGSESARDRQAEEGDMPARSNDSGIDEGAPSPELAPRAPSASPQRLDLWA
jgi:hypothetical protein